MSTRENDQGQSLDPEEYHRLLRHAFDASPAGMLMADARGRITLANRRVAEIFGFPQSELIGLPVDALVPERLRSVHEGDRAEYGKAPGGRHLGHGRDLVGRKRDGSEIPVEIGLSPVKIDGSQYVLAAVADISERQSAERAARARKERLEALMANAGEGVTVLDERGEIKEVNPRMQEILGRSAEDVVGHHIREFATGAGAEAGLRGFREAVSAGAGRVRDAEILRPDGSVAVVDFTLSTYEVGGERVVLSIARETTQERELRRQLDHSQRLDAVGRLAGGVAHDFNNLLTAILGNAELLDDGLEPADPLRSDVAEIVHAALRASDLTRQLLAFSRRQILEPRVLDPSELIHDLERMLLRVIGEDVTLTTRVADDIGNVRADRGQLEQVILNLVVNARDAMPGGGTLVIEAAPAELDRGYEELHVGVEPGRYAMVAVSDTGVGMSKDVQARIFEPFFTTKEPTQGTGLGLSTVYGIVEQSGGHISVYSELGTGTTFRIYLPQVDAPADRSAAEPPGPPEGGTERILVVEDEAGVRRLARQLLEHRGYSVVEAATPAEAMASLRDHAEPIDLLLTDVMMPGMSGPDLARRLAAERPGLRVLFVSGYSAEIIAPQGVLEPAIAFLQKPYTGDQLARKVRSVLDRPGPDPVP